jgi:hypothetical protein
MLNRKRKVESETGSRNINFPKKGRMPFIDLDFWIFQSYGYNKSQFCETNFLPKSVVFNIILEYRQLFFSQIRTGNQGGKSEQNSSQNRTSGINVNKTFIAWNAGWGRNSGQAFLRRKRNNFFQSIENYIDN